VYAYTSDVARPSSLHILTNVAEDKKKKKKEKKFRKVTWHNVFVSAAMDAYRGLNKNNNKSAPFDAISSFKKSLPSEKLDQFFADYAPVLSALNDAHQRTPDDLKSSLKNRNKELGIEVHPIFDDINV
jgi:hypothetical protein